MSSSKRSASNDSKILASLERGSGASTVKSAMPPVSQLWRKSRISLLFLLCVGLAWLTYDNATSVANGPDPVVAAAQEKQIAPPLTVPAPAPPVAAAVERVPVSSAAIINEEAALAKPAVVLATAPPVPATPVPLATPDKAKLATRSMLARKASRPASSAATEAAAPDSDVAILSAIVAQGHAAKAAEGR